MSVRPSDMNDIYLALRSGLAAAESLSTWVRGPDGRDRVQAYERALRAGEQAFSRLSDAWPRARVLLEQAARDYDRYVTSEPQGCSCHLSAPCSFCTCEADEDEEQHPVEREGEARTTEQHSPAQLEKED